MLHARIKYLPLAAITVAPIAGPASAAPTATPTIAKAIIQAPLTLQEVDRLKFGHYLWDGLNDASVDLDPADDSATATLTNLTLLSADPTHAAQRGRLQFVGTADSAVTVEITSWDGKLYLNGDTDAGSIDTTLSLDGTWNETNLVYDYTIGSNGLLQIYVGGEVTIPTGTITGPYSGNYSITLNYD